MKNRTILVLCTSLFVLNLTVKAQTYSFSVYQEPYISVGIGFPLTKGVFDNPSYVVPLGFEFQLFDEFITTLNSHGDLFEGGVLAGGIENQTASLILPFSPDIIDRGFHVGSSMSAIYFSHTGEPGQRVFTQEWLNVGFANGDRVKNIYTDYINFQLKLYEESGKIIIHFGPSSIQNPAADYNGKSGPRVGILKNVLLTPEGVPEETLILTDNPSNPIAIHEFLPVFLNGSIPENTVYLFSRGGTSVKDEKENKSIPAFYPNPTSGDLYLRESMLHEISFPVRVFNVSGQQVSLLSDPNRMSLAGLPAGIYTIQYQTTKGLKNEKIMILPD